MPGLGFDDDLSPEKGQTARISLPVDALPAPGQVLELEPQIDTRWVTLRVDALLSGAEPGVGREPGGELAFFEPRDDGPPAMHVASVISGVEKLQDGIQLLVRPSETARDALEANVGVVGKYFAPYYVEGPVHQTASNATGVVLPIPPGDGTRTAYLAVSTSDVRENEGPLSVPAQITAVRQPPSGEPARPYPCDLGRVRRRGDMRPRRTKAAGRRSVSGGGKARCRRPKASVSRWPARSTTASSRRTGATGCWHAEATSRVCRGFPFCPEPK